MKELYVWIVCIASIVGLIAFLFLVTIKTNDINNTDNYEVVEFTHKNHNYIFVNIGTGQARIGGLVHDPDCKFCNNK